MTPSDPLAKLNPEQRRAVEHGVGVASPPLLVIAGAGSGKTNTLAHRVANLIVGGVDPRRILLMTFSRRAASEMTRRVESICAQVLGPKAGMMTEALHWAGTFHAIGARLLREYAEQLGLQPRWEEAEDILDGQPWRAVGARGRCTRLITAGPNAGPLYSTHAKPADPVIQPSAEPTSLHGTLPWRGCMRP